MIACPLCQDERLIRIPPEYGEPTAHILDPGNIHRVRGENCWANGAQAYRGTKLRYQGTNGTGRIVPEVFTPNWQPLSPLASQAVVNHSPDGFEWGYGGSGPAQLALGILMDHTGDVPFAQRYFQLFKGAYVACWRDTWQVTVESLNIFRDEVVSQWEEDHRGATQDQAQEEVAYG